MLDAVGAGREGELAFATERKRNPAFDLGVDGFDINRRRPPNRQTIRDAHEPWPPQRPRFGPGHRGAKCFSPILRNMPAGSSGNEVLWDLCEIAERIVDRRTAVGRRQRHVHGIERRQLQDMLCVDCVGIAQPVLDRGDRQFLEAALGVAVLASVAGSVLPFGTSSAFAKRIYFSPAAIAASQRFSPATASSLCRKREATEGAPLTFAA